MTQLDRRTALKWVLAAGAAAQLPDFTLAAAGPPGALSGRYGKDPNLLRTYAPGELWPLTMNEAQRRSTWTLCDLIIPADEHSPAASAVATHAFIDEWISAPYPICRRDRDDVITGLAWLDGESQQRFARFWAEAESHQQARICDDISQVNPGPQFSVAAAFFQRFRELTALGYYTTPIGMKALGYAGNEPLVAFNGPPPEVLKRLGFG